MKKLLTSLAAFTALTAAASAADLPRRAAPPIFTPVPVFTWTGFYAGFNAGYGFGVGNDDPTFVAYNTAAGVFNLPNLGGLPVGGIAAFNNSSSDGFTGGGQIGYNYQFTPGSGVVVGIEADAQYVDFGRRRNNAVFFGAFDDGTPTQTVFGSPLGDAALNPNVVLVNPNGLSSIDYYGTVRGRLGYAFDRVLFYGTGGFAYGGGGGREFGLPNSSRDSFKTGYAVGGGVEYALPTDSFLNFFRSSAVTLKVEGLYVNLRNERGSNVVAFNTVTGATLLANDPNVLVINGNRRDTEFAVVRAGINYKFGSY